jgi:hypothetical protein
MTTRTSKGDRRGQSSLLSAGNKPRGGKPTGARKGRKSIAPVRVGKDRNWGPIAMFAVVGLLAAGIIGYAFWAQRDTGTPDWQEQAAEIEGILNYRETNPESMTDEYQQHYTGSLTYDTTPPAYGSHNGTWQNCQGDVYTEPIHNEHAVHSLEHGAVWITYRPDLPADQVEELADRVEGTEKMFMSPYPDLDAPISLQAWGYQLKVDDAGDPRIDEFIRTLRINTSLEGPGARCDAGITTGRSTPTLNAGDQMGS